MLYNRIVRVCLLIGVLVLMVGGTIGVKVSSYERFHLENDSAPLAKKIGSRDEYTLYYHYFHKAEPEIMKKITKTVYEMQEYEGYQITLKEYVYDGNNVFACFTVKNKKNTEKGLKLFEDVNFNGEGNILSIMTSQEENDSLYRITNDCGRENINVNSDICQYLENPVYNNEKYFFYHGVNTDLEETRSLYQEWGESEISEKTKNELYLVDKTMLKSEGVFINIEKAKLLTFSMEITTQNYEVKLGGDKIIITPLEIRYEGDYLESVKNVTLSYEDGKKVQIIRDADAVNDNLYLGDQKAKGKKLTKIYRFKNPINFDMINKIEGENLDGEQWSEEF